MTRTLTKLKELTSLDVEDLQLATSDEPPSMQLRLLEAAARQTLNGEVKGLEALKSLEIVQTVLSGAYVLLPERQLVELLHSIVQFSDLEKSKDLKERSAMIASLLLNRMRSARARLPAETLEILKRTEEGADSKQISGIASAMRKRIRDAVERIQAPMILRTFELPDLDISKAAKNVREDAMGDWYHDPWGWPELEWLGASGSHNVKQRLQSDKLGWIVPIDVEKREGGVRPGLVINPCDRVAYQTLVDDMVITIAGDAPDWVHGWRLSRESRNGAEYASNTSEWKRFSSRVATFGETYRYTAHLDIQSFFSTVDVDILISCIARKYRITPVIDRLEVFLREWNEKPNGSGIPQRFLASSVLAHAMLRPVDVYLERIRKRFHNQGFAVSRWMDDIWIHSNDKQGLHTTVAELEEILAQSRLSLNAAKT